MPRRLLPLALAACLRVPDAPDAPVDFGARGPYPAGHARVDLRDDARARDLRVELWYPAAVEGAGLPVPEAFFEPGSARDTWAAELDAAPAACATRATRATLDARASGGGPYPLVLFSHCDRCVRFSSFSVAEHLASHGFVVAAPDHTGNTRLDELAGSPLPLTTDTLQLRAADQSFVLDRLLDALPVDDLEVDPNAIGAMGHSFGSVTSGLFAQEDGRPRAVLGLAAPLENPLLRGVRTAELGVPLALVLAQEDHSIQEAGNVLIRADFEAAQAPAWLLELPDAGHWSVSDLAGMTGFEPGCGDDTRQLDPDEAFTYPPLPDMLSLTSEIAASFFAATLTDDDRAMDRLVLDGVAFSAKRVDATASP